MNVEKLETHTHVCSECIIHHSVNSSQNCPRRPYYTVVHRSAFVAEMIDQIDVYDSVEYK